MKRIFKILSTTIFCLLLTSCERTTLDYRNYLSGHYVLSDAAIVDFETDMSTPYFKFIPCKENVKNRFNLTSSYIDLKVGVNEGKAYGFGDFKIESKSNEFSVFEGSFDYYCYYTSIYGNSLIMSDETKPDYFGRQNYRRNNWWVRTEIFINEISDKPILLEFIYTEGFEIPEEFNHKVW